MYNSQLASTPLFCDFEDSSPCAGGISMLSAFRLQLRHLINSAVWSMGVLRDVFEENEK